MSTRDDLLASIANTSKDYQVGVRPAPTPAHVDRWVNQFDSAVQLPILTELDHVLKKTYFNRELVAWFLKGLIINKDLAGNDPCSFWRGINFLDIQQGGNSQRDMLSLFDSFLYEHCGVHVAGCGGTEPVYVYLDDVIFTGGRVLQDMSSWIKTSAPAKAKVHIITIAYHRGGQYYAKNKIAEVADAAKKKIELVWWRCIEIEDTKARINTSDVLRPTMLPPADTLVAAYAAGMQHKPIFRTPSSVGMNEFFSSETGRHVLEQEFLKAGVRIRQMCPHFIAYQRPLGTMGLETLGFGSLIVTYRNCPNNAPLALWAGDPWYPLFERTTNSATAIKRLFGGTS